MICPSHASDNPNPTVLPLSPRGQMTAFPPLPTDQRGRHNFLISKHLCEILFFAEFLGDSLTPAPLLGIVAGRGWHGNAYPQDNDIRFLSGFL